MTIQLYKGDCLKVMQDLPDNSVDLIVTSPPYNKKGFTGIKKTSGSNHTWGHYSIDYKTYNDDLPSEQYLDWQANFLVLCGKLLKDGGSIFYNHKPIRANNKIIFHPYTILERVGNKGIFLYQEIIWNRKNSPNVRNDVLLPCTERLYWLVKNKPTVYKDQLADEYKSEVWNIAPRADKEHPATFPFNLAENCIKLTTKEGGVVLDPFMGSGTTGVVCKRTNRNFIGIELDENYFNIANNRIRGGL